MKVWQLTGHNCAAEIGYMPVQADRERETETETERVRERESKREREGGERGVYVGVMRRKHGWIEPSKFKFMASFPSTTCGLIPTWRHSIIVIECVPVDQKCIQPSGFDNGLRIQRSRVLFSMLVLCRSASQALCHAASIHSAGLDTRYNTKDWIMILINCQKGAELFLDEMELYT